MSLKLATKPKTQIIIQEEAMHDLIIIGGGPAGLAAAIYSLRDRLKVLLVEKMMFGGQASTTSHIDNYPGFPDGVSGQELSQRMGEQAKKLSLEIIWGDAVQLKKSGNYFEAHVDGKIYSARATIIATGTNAAKLGVPGEDQFRGRGVSYCAVCDGAFYQNKNIMVVGGGNSAVEEALFLTRYANKVSIIHRRDELRCDKIIAEKAKNHPKIYFFWHSVVEEIKGEKTVKEVSIKDLISGKNLNVPVDGVFIYVGNNPNTAFVKDLVKLDKGGFIQTDEEMKTSLPGLFAAGDVRAKSLRQVVTAVADGAIAAESAREFIEKLT